MKNIRNLSRAGGKTDERWTGPYAIVNIRIVQAQKIE